MRFLHLSLLILLTPTLYSQTGSIANLPLNTTSPQDGGIHGNIRTGLGFATIHGDPHLAITFSPEFQLSKLNAAFELELYFHDKLRIRDEMYDSDPGWLRMIRHIYWGTPSDAFHTGVGTLYNINFGSGLLLSNYTNASNWDERDFGFILDLNFPNTSVEVFTEDILDPELIGGRVGVAPLTGLTVPILNTWEVGVTAVQDSSPDPRKHSGHNETLNAFAFDTAFSPIRNNTFLWKIFAQHALYEDYGTANSLGTSFTLPGLTDFMDLELLYEARFVEEQFIPGLINTSYELMRQRDGIHNLLNTAPDGDNHFLQARLSLFEGIHLLANYSTPLDTDDQGIFSLEANIPEFFSPIAFSASYTKTNMDEFGDISDIDEHTYVRAIADWQLTSLLYMSMLYRAHWIETTPNTFDKQETVRPQLTLRWAF